MSGSFPDVSESYNSSIHSKTLHNDSYSGRIFDDNNSE